MNYYEQIKAEVVKVCPEILALKWGCKVIVDLGEYEEVTILNECGKCPKHKKVVSCTEDCDVEDAWFVYGGEEMEGYYSIVIEKSRVKEILGSTIELHHILRTIAKTPNLNGLILVSENGRFHKKTAVGYDELCNYNLTLPLASQSEETLKWLSELLTGNNK